MFWSIVFVLFVVIHNQIIFGMFAWSLASLTFRKTAPYSSFYIGIIFLVQAIYSNCPVTDINNFFAAKAGFPLETNELWFGTFGSYETLVRILCAPMGLVFIYHAWKTWNDPAQPVNFSHIFRKPSFSMPLDAYPPELRNSLSNSVHNILESRIHTLGKMIQGK